MTPKQKLAIYAAAFLLTLVVIWMNRYEYQTVQWGENSTLPCRINRFTGKAEVWIMGAGWTDFGAGDTATPTQAVTTPTPTPKESPSPAGDFEIVTPTPR
jgi:hypothetical protein